MLPVEAIGSLAVFYGLHHFGFVDKFFRRAVTEQGSKLGLRKNPEPRLPNHFKNIKKKKLCEKIMLRMIWQLTNENSRQSCHLYENPSSFPGQLTTSTTSFPGQLTSTTYITSTSHLSPPISYPSSMCSHTPSGKNHGERGKEILEEERSSDQMETKFCWTDKLKTYKMRKVTPYKYICFNCEKLLFLPAANKVTTQGGH